MRFNSILLVLTSVVLANAHYSPKKSSIGVRQFEDDAIPEISKQTSSIVDSILSEIEGLGSCLGCLALTKVLKTVAQLGDDSFVSIATKVCIASKKIDADVCTGIIALEGPILAEVLRSLSVGGRTSKSICASFVGWCAYPDVLPYSGTIPPKPKKLVKKQTVAAAAPLKVVHVSDMHIDRTYETGANFNCTKPICCRSWTDGDTPGNTDTPAGSFGSTHCDTPVSLEESVYSAIKNVAPNADFMLFTGDVVDAALWLVNEADVIGDLNDMYGRMTNNGFQKVYAVVGNHDVAPVNLFEVPKNNNSSSQWVYDTLMNVWNGWIGQVTATNAQHNSGSYSILHPGTSLRIISLNTNYYYKLNLWLYNNDGLNVQRDPAGLFAWLTAQLLAAEKAGETVHIIGHMPLGVDDAVRDYSNYFNVITTRFASTIKGMFWGHTHTDEFEVTYADPKNPSFDTAKITSYITPCVTPRNSNPSFRVYTLDPVTYGVLDYDHYYTDASALGSSPPVWTKLYSAKATYGALVNPAPAGNAELTPAFWSNVTTAFENNDAAFQQWFTRKTAGADAGTCTGDCKTAEICQMRASREEDNCQNSSLASLISKRDELEQTQPVVKMAQDHGRGECGGQFIEVFQHMPDNRRALEIVVEETSRLGHKIR